MLEGAPSRFLVSHHVAVAGDDGAAAEPVLFVRDERGVTVTPPPGSELGRRFPGGSFRIAPADGTALECVGGDELLFADGRSRGGPFLALVTAPARSVGLRITGQLVVDAARAEPTPLAGTGADRSRAESFWTEQTGPLALEPPASSPLAGEVARLQQILPWFAHDAYQGGPERQFQRAESSAYFGREIALMYTHAHLRYADAVARWGDGDALFHALQQANPIGLRARVPSARPRQSSCYTTSSDADFADRYEAAARYGEVMSGTVPLDGGWRVYSSGPGIFVRLVHQCLLGVQHARSRLVLDPVLPRALDGLRARVAVAGIPLELEYRIGARGHGPTALWLDGHPLEFEREANPYRVGGAEIPISALRAGSAEDRSTLVVELG